MKTILVITIGYPHPNKGASTVVFFHYLKAIRESGHNVEHLILISPSEVSRNSYHEYVAAIKPDASFHISTFVVPVERVVYRKYLKLHLFEINSLNSIINRNRPDLTICFDILAAATARKVGLNNLLVWLGDLYFHSTIYHAGYSLVADPKISTFFRLIHSAIWSTLWKRLYIKVLSDQRNVVVSSKSSETHLRKLGINSCYWPYPWPTSFNQCTNKFDKYQKPTFIMFGNLAALGSRSGFNFLIRSVYPHLLRYWGVKGFSIRVAGSNTIEPWVKVAIESKAEFEFVGYVDDLQSEVLRCHAALAPISVPVGNRSRILTIMSMGALLIAHKNTSLGNPDLVSGFNCLLSDTAFGFAEHLNLAYTHPDLTIKLGTAAKNTYNRLFAPEIATQRMTEKINHLLSHNFK